MKFSGRGYRIASWIGIAVAAAGLTASVAMGWWIASLWLAALLVYSGWQVGWEQQLPDLFDTLLVAAAVLNAVGWAFNLFAQFRWYDLLAHAYTIFAITLTAGFLIYSSSQVRFEKIGWLFITSIFCFGMAVGGLWEIVEWAFRVIGTVNDTVFDLIMDAAGAFLAALLSARVAVEDPRSALSTRQSKSSRAGALSCRAG